MEEPQPDRAPTYVHIGNPPVIGSDGILYGYYQSPHLADVPITPAGGGHVDHHVARSPRTRPACTCCPNGDPAAKYFIDHVIDITDK